MEIFWLLVFFLILVLVGLSQIKKERDLTSAGYPAPPPPPPRPRPSPTCAYCGKLPCKCGAEAYPHGVLKSDHPLTRKDIEDLMREWGEARSGGDYAVARVPVNYLVASTSPFPNAIQYCTTDEPPPSDEGDTILR